MKILFLSRRYYPDRGGVEKHIDKISEVLKKKGYEISLVTQSQGKDNTRNGISIYRIPESSNNFSEKIHVWKWLWINKELFKQADVVHAHDVLWWYWPYKFLYLSKKCYITFHGYETYPIKKGAILSRKISEFFANGNIIVGEFMKKWYKTKSDFVIYGGVDMSNKINRLQNRESAVFMGRLDEHTGVLDYAMAIDLVKEKYPSFKFQILGEGIYEKKVSRYKPIGFKRNIDDYFNKNNFAFVSRYLSILEALANRRQVFSLYDNEVKKDYLKMSPFSKFIVIEEDPKELAEKVIYFLQNKKDSDILVDDGFEWVKNQTWDNVAKTYIKLWEK